MAGCIFQSFLAKAFTDAVTLNAGSGMPLLATPGYNVGTLALAETAMSAFGSAVAL